MRLARVAAPHFDLALTLHCGQVFHWQPLGRGFAGAIGDDAVFIEQCGDELRTNGRPQMIGRYFALDHPLLEIYGSFPDDPAMAEALAFCRGLRIIRQPAWECLATFITSSMKQVAHIAQISHTLRKRFGKKLALRDAEVFAYPEPERLAALEEKDLRECALGYRAKNLLATARMIASGELDLQKVARLDDDSARAELCRLPGVGEKVANCVLLFAFERVRAFPIDVWIERVLRDKYFKGKRRVTAKRLRQFCEKYFGPFGGYAQQYLFHHARSTRRKTQ
ncbi:MAG: N-glycosylase/DNA lyase [Chthoniobacter sp.]|jgi:N-glycosylase/DNA lyase|nr:N-glycosylase/DNA lyase [Chthoniobacter sp.]